MVEGRAGGYGARDRKRRGSAPGRRGIGLLAALVVALPVLSPVGPAMANDLDAGCPEDRVPTGTFEDVLSGSVHATAIECIVLHQVTEGVGDDRYDPASTVTRGQMATFLARVVEASDAELPEGSPRFVDTEGSVHEPAIERLAEAGIAQGRTTTEFAPLDEVTRAQMATFLRRTYEYIAQEELDDGVSYFDDIAGDVHEDNINAVAGAGFASGVAERTYAPSRDVTREQMASFLARMIDRLVRDEVLAVPGPPAAYLSERSPVDSSGSWSDRTVRIDATDYARSIRSWSDNGMTSGSSVWREYNLDRDFDVLRATVGVGDGSETGSRAQFDVTVDGRLAVSEQVRLAESREIEVDITDAARVRLQITNLEGRPIGAYGDARLVKE